MREIILIGGGGHCRAAIDVIECEGRFAVAGVLERPVSALTEVLGYPVLGDDDDLSRLLRRHAAALVTIGQIKSPAARIRAFRAAREAGAYLPSIVSPHAHVARSARIGAGTLAMHGVVINACATVGQNCIVNSQSLVEHDACVGDNCHVSTGARVNGGVTIENNCFIGSGAVLKNGIVIGAGSVIGAGCVVTRDVEPNSFIKYTRERAS